jgi:hypothetical protein
MKTRTKEAYALVGINLIFAALLAYLGSSLWLINFLAASLVAYTEYKCQEEEKKDGE